jgi:hypothetical protein
MFYIVEENLMPDNIVSDHFSLFAIALEIGSRKVVKFGCLSGSSRIDWRIELDGENYLHWDSQTQQGSKVDLCFFYTVYTVFWNFLLVSGTSNVFASIFTSSIRLFDLR